MYIITKYSTLTVTSHKLAMVTFQRMVDTYCCAGASDEIVMA